MPTCVRSGKHRLGIRCRIMEEPSPIDGKGKTDALWSIESDAFLCDTHALAGVDLTLVLEENNSGYASLRVLPQGMATRKIKIKT